MWPRLLYVAMFVVLCGGLVGGIRLSLALGQPGPGVVMTWRKELGLYTISYATPPSWPGVAAGKLRVNDLILCIDGMRPSTDIGGRYSIPPAAGGVTCPNGAQKYAALYRERFARGQHEVTFLVERGGQQVTVPNVQLAPFTPAQLAQIFLPFFLLGFGFLAVAAVVLRAAPGAEINVVFAAFATILAAAMMDEASPWRLVDRFESMRWSSVVLMMAPLPLVGAVGLHFVRLLSDQPTVTSWLRRAQWPLYGLGAFFSLVGVISLAADHLPASASLVVAWGDFVTASIFGTAVAAAVALIWTYRTTGSRQVRQQVRLVFLGIAILLAFLVPYLFFFFRRAPVSSYMHILPYVGLAAIGVFAYAILRYQLFDAKSRVLTALLTAIFCILVAALVYLLFGAAVELLALLAVALITAFGLEVRRGPTAFFNRLLRPEALDYQIAARFAEEIARAQDVDDLLAIAWERLSTDLEIEGLAAWLLDEERQSLAHYRDGRLSNAAAIPQGLAEALLAEPAPRRGGSGAEPAYAIGLTYERVALWAPLTAQGQAIGLVGLGPRWTGELYDEPDLQLATIISRRLALSVLTIRQLERLRTASRLVLQAEENERRKIARELHDTVLQFLLVLTYGLDDLAEQEPAFAAPIEQWQDRISAQASELRGLLGYLRAPELLVERGLVPSLRGWLDQVRGETLAVVEAQFDESIEPRLATETKVAIFRVCREAVNNAIKHARATRITVRLCLDGAHVAFSVEDNGQGFDVAKAFEPQAKGYSSLQDLSIYIESVSGRLELQSAPGAGTTVSGWAPTVSASLV